MAKNTHTVTYPKDACSCKEPVHWDYLEGERRHVVNHGAKSLNAASGIVFYLDFGDARKERDKYELDMEKGQPRTSGLMPLPEDQATGAVTKK